MAGGRPGSRSQPARMRDHWWWRPGWRVGRRFYTWHLTFDSQTDLHRVVGAYQAHLQVSELDLVPLEGLHLTIQGVGFTNEVDQGELRDIVTAARDRCAHLSPFDLTLGPARLDPEGIMLPVAPAEPVRRLRATLREAIAQVWGDDRVPEPVEPFTPHVTMAYSNAEGPAAPLIERLNHAQPHQASAILDAVRLIELERDTHVYRWTTLVTVPLSGGTSQ
jgi:2'-5' RNA ligase